MANIKLMLWTAMQTTAAEAHELADFANRGLGISNQIEVVAIAPPSWYMLIGNRIAKDWYDKLMAELKKQQEMLSFIDSASKAPDISNNQTPQHHDTP